MSVSIKVYNLALVLVAFVCLSHAGKFNWTTYQLSSTQMKITQPVNGSSFNLTLHKKAGDLVFIGHRIRWPGSGGQSSYSYWGWEHKYKIDFRGNITGDLAYTILYQGLQLILPSKESGPVRVILPAGYTTGDRILGIARPAAPIR